MSDETDIKLRKLLMSKIIKQAKIKIINERNKTNQKPILIWERSGNPELTIACAVLALDAKNGRNIQSVEQNILSIVLLVLYISIDRFLCL